MVNVVSHANDLSLVIPVFLAPHDYLGPVPPSPLAPIKAPASIALDLPVPMFWPPGMGLGQNKLAMTVLTNNFPICQAQHDCGYLIPHVHIAPSPLNVLTLIQIAFSGRSTKFTASTVKVGGAETGCNTMFSLFPAPMMNCADPFDLPTSAAPTSHFNTVYVGMTWGDFFAGVFAIGISMVVGYLTSRAGGPGGSSVLPGVGAKVVARAVGRALGEAAVKKAGIEAMKDIAQKNAVGLVTSTVNYALTGTGSWKLSVGTPYLGAEVGAKYDNATGTVSAEGSIRSEAVESVGVVDSDEGKVTWSRNDGLSTEHSNTDADGSSTKTTDKHDGKGPKPETQTGMEIGGPTRWGKAL